MQELREVKVSRYIHQNEVDKACFQHYMAHGDYKDLARRAVSDKDLRDEAFNIQIIHKMTYIND